MLVPSTFYDKPILIPSIYTRLRYSVPLSSSAAFSKAAEALLLTQPTVSGHIKNLEHELAVKLIDRLGKRTVPTEAGDILFHYGQKLLALRDIARQEIAAVTGNVAGRLKIGDSTIPGGNALSAVIATFKKKYQSASLQLVIDDTAKVVEAVLNSELSIGVVGERINDPHLETHAYLQDEPAVAVSRQHPRAGRRSIPIDSFWLPHKIP